MLLGGGAGTFLAEQAALELQTDAVGDVLCWVERCEIAF